MTVSIPPAQAAGGAESSAGREHQIANDVVVIFAGGELPTRFLQSCGVVLETKFGRP